MRLQVGCELVFEAAVDVPLLMLVRARSDGAALVTRESRTTEPVVDVREYVDGFGNRCWRLVVPAGGLAVGYTAVVDVESHPDAAFPDAPLLAPQDLPDEAIVFTLPSRQVESDLLLSDAWRLFGDTPRTWARVQAVCDWVHTNVRYDAEASGPGVLGSAVGAYQGRVGVCRDFALLAMGFCRALNIPSRYAFGYMPDAVPDETPMDFHAWFEAFVGGQWYPFDARHNTPRAGRVLVGRGRDAVDAALTTAYGPALLARMTVRANVE